MNCPFCFNEHVWAREPHSEEDYFDGGLDDSNDMSSYTIGYSSPRFQMYFNAGDGKPCSIETCSYGLPSNRWHTIAIYYPKYCPECGRKLDEFVIDERGRTFTKVFKED